MKCRKLAFTTHVHLVMCKHKIGNNYGLLQSGVDSKKQNSVGIGGWNAVISRKIQCLLRFFKHLLGTGTLLVMKYTQIK